MSVNFQKMLEDGVEALSKELKPFNMQETERDCSTCKHHKGIDDNLGGRALYCKHYKYATECVRNGHKYWEPYGKKETNQNAKADAGKPQLTLVPRQILFDIAEVRAFGVKKYGDPDNWKKVDIQRYRDAAFRHFMAYLDEPQGNDEESGLSHLAHLACNIAFLCELEKKETNKNNEARNDFGDN